MLDCAAETVRWTGGDAARALRLLDSIERYQQVLAAKHLGRPASARAVGDAVRGVAFAAGRRFVYGRPKKPGTLGKTVHRSRNGCPNGRTQIQGILTVIDSILGRLGFP